MDAAVDLGLPVDAGLHQRVREAAGYLLVPSACHPVAGTPLQQATAVSSGAGDSMPAAR